MWPQFYIKGKGSIIMWWGVGQDTEIQDTCKCNGHCRIAAGTWRRHVNEGAIKNSTGTQGVKVGEINHKVKAMNF